eukprot:Nk52_evm33s215 gene=Nk52_evmTU33s215
MDRSETETIPNYESEYYKRVKRRLDSGRISTKFIVFECETPFTYQILKVYLKIFDRDQLREELKVEAKRNADDNIVPFVPVSLEIDVALLLNIAPSLGDFLIYHFERCIHLLKVIYYEYIVLPHENEIPIQSINQVNFTLEILSFPDIPQLCLENYITPLGGWKNFERRVPSLFYSTGVISNISNTETFQAKSFSHCVQPECPGNSQYIDNAERDAYVCSFCGGATKDDPSLTHVALRQKFELFVQGAGTLENHRNCSITFEISIPQGKIVLGEYVKVICRKKVHIDTTKNFLDGRTVIRKCQSTYEVLSYSKVTPFVSLLKEYNTHTSLLHEMYSILIPDFAKLQCFRTLSFFIMLSYLAGGPSESCCLLKDSHFCSPALNGAISILLLMEDTNILFHVSKLLCSLFLDGHTAVCMGKFPASLLPRKFSSKGGSRVFAGEVFSHPFLCIPFGNHLLKGEYEKLFNVLTMHWARVFANAARDEIRPSYQPGSCHTSLLVGSSKGSETFKTSHGTNEWDNFEICISANEIDAKELIFLLHSEVSPLLQENDSVLKFKTKLSSVASQGCALGKESLDLMNQFFLISRKLRCEGNNLSNCPSSGLATMIKTSKAHAKLFLRDSVSKLDAIVAIYIFDMSLKAKTGRALLHSVSTPIDVSSFPTETKETCYVLNIDIYCIEKQIHNLHKNVKTNIAVEE